MKKKIAIIGAGIGGLTLANLLQNNSEFEFTIYEKEELQYILRDIQGFKNEFNIVHEKFIEHSGIIIDVEKIDQNIINLTRLKGSVDN